MGYSRKNPHLPDGWHAGNSRGRGGSRALEIQVGGGLDLKLFFRGHWPVGVIKNVTSVFQIFDFTEETSSESKKVVVFQSMHFLP